MPKELRCRECTGDVIKHRICKAPGNHQNKKVSCWMEMCQNMSLPATVNVKVFCLASRRSCKKLNSCNFRYLIFKTRKMIFKTRFSRGTYYSKCLDRICPCYCPTAFFLLLISGGGLYIHVSSKTPNYFVPEQQHPLTWHCCSVGMFWALNWSYTE